MSQKISGFDEYYGQRSSRNRSVRLITLDQVYRAYSAMSNSIYVLLNESRLNKKYSTNVFNKSLINSINSILDDFFYRLEKSLVKKCTLLASYSIRSERQDVKRLGIRSTASPQEYLPVVDLYIDEFMMHCDNIKSRIIGHVTSLIKKDGILIRRIMHLEKKTRIAAISEYSRKKDFDFRLSFVDRAGRSKKMEWYIGVLVNSTMLNIELDSYIYAMTADGLDLAQINPCSGDTRCSKYDGVILSVSGKNENYQSFDSLMSSKDIWHPNCAHLITAVKE